MVQRKIKIEKWRVLFHIGVKVSRKFYTRKTAIMGLLGHEPPDPGREKREKSAPVLLQTVFCFQILDLDFFISPNHFALPLLSNISPLARITTHSFFSHHKDETETCQKFPFPSQATLHLTLVSNNGGRSMELTYSSSNFTPKKPGHPTRSSCSRPEQQRSLKVFKEETQSTFSIYKVSLLTKRNITYYKVQLPVFVPFHEEFTGIG